MGVHRPPDRASEPEPTLRRSLLALLAPALGCLAGCASDDGLWLTYQAAGEAASLNARYDKAETLLGQALAETAERPAERTRSLVALARVARERGDLASARTRIGEARASASALAPDAPETVRLALEEAWLALDEGAAQDAAARFAAAGERARSVLGEADPAVGWAAAGRGEALRRLGDRAGARAALEDALARHGGEANALSVRPSEPLGLATELTSLGALRRAEGDLEGARGALREAAALAGRELGTDHPLVAAALAELSRVELALGDREAARRAAARAAGIARNRLPPEHPTRLAAEEALAAAAP